MRLIDADALIESIKNTADLGGWIGEALYQIKQVAIKYIDSAPSIEPKRREWILCSERLPSSSGKCLVTEGVERKTTSIGYFSAEYKRFYSAMDVIAWMPLPEPYCGADMREREGE